MTLASSSSSKLSLWYIFLFFLASSIAGGALGPAPAPFPLASPDPVLYSCNLTWPRPEQKAKYDGCVATLRAVPGTRNATVPDVAVTSVELALRWTKTTREYIRELQARIKDGPTNMTLSFCSWNYDKATTNLGDAIVSIKDGYYPLCIADLTFGLGDVYECDEGFDSGMKNPLGERGKDIVDIGAVGLAVCYEYCKKNWKQPLDCMF